jgi:hypothetical protein
MEELRKERIAYNESAFRDLNDRLQDSVHGDSPDGHFAGFVCECGDADCDATVRLALPTYESIRQDAKLFFLLPGHEAPEAEDVVDDGEGYVVVRKHEDVADIVEGTDRRHDGR